jgi:predicted dehydrogenase
MTSRRTFLTSVGAGAAIACISPLSAVPYLQDKTESNLVRIGIIGAENSHTISFGKTFNVEKKFPGVEVTHLWGETDEFARKAAAGGNIPTIVKDPKEMLGKIDALIVDHRHPKYHLQAAIPFIQAGIPTFIDKPFCYRVEEGRTFLELARKHNAPVTSFSSVANCDATYDIKRQIASIPDINHVICHGPVDLDSPYGGIFFYGVHMIQPLMFIFGEEIIKVKVTRNGKKGNASLVYKNGLFVTLIFKNEAYGWQTFVEADSTKKELLPLISSVIERDPSKMDRDIVAMFNTRIEPRSHASMLREVAILEALEKSSLSDVWVQVESI